MLMYEQGYFNPELFNHAPGPCKFVPGVEDGAENMETLRNGLTFIIKTSGLRLMIKTKEINCNNISTGIMLFDLNQDFDNAFCQLTFEESFDLDSSTFHGISGYENYKTGQITLLVVNHHLEGERIEKFTFNAETMTLIHVKTFNFPFKRLVINDVVAISDTEFYFTKSLSEASPMMVQVMLGLPWGTVSYHDGQNYKVVQDGFSLANGINISPDKRYLYVSHLFGFQSFHIQQDRSLKFHFERQFPTFSSDNVFVEHDTGHVWVGGQPVIHECINHMYEGKQSPCSSRVLRYTMSDGEITDVQDVFTSNGTTSVRCASGANYYKKKLLIGSIMHKLLYCEVKSL